MVGGRDWLCGWARLLARLGADPNDVGNRVGGLVARLYGLSVASVEREGIFVCRVVFSDGGVVYLEDGPDLVVGVDDGGLVGFLGSCGGEFGSDLGRVVYLFLAGAVCGKV